jgi:hypothetical protein
MSLTKVTYSMIKGAPVSVLDFGAVGNGVADDTVAVQAAIDSSPNGVINFPSGTYKLSAPILLTDTSGHNFQGVITGNNATIVFTNAGAAADTDAAMAHGFQAYPLTNGSGGDITGLRDVVIEGLRIQGPTHGACVYITNSQNVTIQNCQFTLSRYGVATECCINTKILDNVFTTHINAGLGMIMSSNTSNVWYGSATPSSSYWNDSPLVQGNGFLSSSSSSTLAHILDYGSQSESVRLIQNNFFYSYWSGAGAFVGTQYGYVGRNCNATMIRNWFENVNYPVRILNTNVAEGAINLPGVTGAEPSGTFAVSNFVNGFSYNGDFNGNWFARSLISLELSGITGGPSRIGQNVSQFIQNAGVHLKSTQTGSQVIVDSGDTVIVPVGSYDYKSLALPSTYAPLFNKFTSYTPTVSSTTGTITSYTINKAIYSQVKADLVSIIIDVSITNNGTGATILGITLPTEFAAIAGSVSGRCFVATGHNIAGTISSTGIFITRYDGTYPVATGDRFIVSGQYQIA